jgi:hypothetical protein
MSWLISFILLGFCIMLVFLLQTSTEENSNEETESSQRDSSSSNSGKTITQSQPGSPPSASKKRPAPEPTASQSPITAGQGGLRTKSRCIKRARKEPQASSLNQEISNVIPLQTLPGPYSILTHCCSHRLNISFAD